MDDFLALPFARSISAHPVAIAGQHNVTLLTEGRFDRTTRYTQPASEMGYMPVYDPQMVLTSNDIEPTAALQTFKTAITGNQYMRYKPMYADPSMIRKRQNLENIALFQNPHTHQQMVLDYATFGTWPSKPQLNLSVTYRPPSDINIFE